MKKTLLLLLHCFFLSPLLMAQTTVFEQDFQASSTVGDYIGSGVNQFTDLTASSGTSVNIASGRLLYDRTSAGGSGRFVKTTSFAGNPNTLYLQFDMEVPTSAASQSSAITLRLGSGFTDNGTIPSDATTYAKLYVNFVGASGGFQLRDQEGSQNSSFTYTGSQQITWVLNNSGASIPYIGPDGNSYNLANDKHQFWVGATKAFTSDLNATTATQSLSNIKMIFSGGSNGTLGSVAFDNFLMRSIEGTLPVSLVSFGVQTNEQNQIELRWATAAEKNSKYFSVGRSANAQHYEEIAQIDAAGYSNTLREYRWIDPNPPLGLKYYRLTQVDTDGSSYTYRPISISTETPLAVYPNPSNGQEFYLDDTDFQQMSLQNLSGQEIPISIEKTLNHTRVMPSKALETGLYLLKTQTDATFRTFKVSVW